MRLVALWLISACGEEPASCEPVEAYPTRIVDGAVCADYGAAPSEVGCATGGGCAAEMKYGSDPDDPDTIWSFGGCLPEGWERTDLEWQECP